MNIYQDLTLRFNGGKLRAIISSGQAVVLHRLAIMSKDGDWILKEDDETMKYILEILSKYGAVYRFGAPLDIRWLKYGWSSHFEFYYNGLRVRTDFCTRPPRITTEALEKLWKEKEGGNIPFVDIVNLAELKKTNREKDYAVIGELARLMKNKKDQLLFSRSARDMINIEKDNPELISELTPKRPVLKKISAGRDILEEALDAEKRTLIHANEERLKAYMDKAQNWLNSWADIQKKITGIPLVEAHNIVVNNALTVLPFSTYS